MQEEPRSSPNFKERKAGREKAAPGSPTAGDAIIKVRQDLSEAQRSRGAMETRLQSVVEELQKLKIQSSLDSKLIGELSKEKATLSTGMRDRDEELRGKAKLLEVGVNTAFTKYSDRSAGRTRRDRIVNAPAQHGRRDFSEAET